jgi:hypothetical protein
VKRECGPDGLALVGYPQITGRIGGCDPQGYPEHADEHSSDPPDGSGDGPICGEPFCIEHGVGTVGCPLTSAVERVK